jgi:hypothetical protein
MLLIQRTKTFHSNIKVVFIQANCTIELQALGLGTMNAFKCHYRQQLNQKTWAMIHGDLLQDATQVNQNVLSVLILIVINTNILHIKKL